nr:chromo domain-containing protein cec-1 [Ipomoea batatas]
MKGLSKPISSPGRTDKFPPPLMRFLRSNAGSRSRGRSRSSPMFMRKKNSVAIETTQEPSSPKVTCIGQVRVKRSSKSSSTAGAGISRSKSHRKTRRTSSSKQQPCWWVRKLLICRGISLKFRKPQPISSFFRKWAFFCCGFGCRKIRDNTDPPPRVDPDPKEPARTGERLNPDAGYWKLRRFAEPHPSS